jgi:DNA-binding response OmpR family regulator
MDSAASGDGGMSGEGDVLIVDDDPDMVEAIEMALESNGYRSRHAANGKQALEVVDHAMPGLILLDMLMPVMNGWEFARALHARYGDAVPLVIVTAAEHADARGAEVHADAVLPKPFDLNELLNVVSRFVSPAPGGAGNGMESTSLGH